MGLGFEVNWLDCASMAFILLLVGCLEQKKKEKNNEENLKKKKKKRKEKSYDHSIFTSLVFGISMVCRQYHGLIIRGHFRLRDLFFV